MPRQARLDAPETLHHVMVRGIERTRHLPGRHGPGGLRRPPRRAGGDGASTVYAWALLPNHAHLLVRTGSRAPRPEHAVPPHGLRRGLQPAPQAGGPPLPEPVQVHRGGGGAVPPGTGPLPPPEPPPGQGRPRPPAPRPLPLDRPQRPPRDRPPPLAGHPDDSRPVRRHPPPARVAYRAFVAAGRPPGAPARAPGRRPAPQSLGGWAAVATLRRGREAYQGDERILGDSAFVEAMRQAVAAHVPGAAARIALEPLLARVCQAVGTHPRAARRGRARPRPPWSPAPGSPTAGSRASAVPVAPWPRTSASSRQRSRKRPGAAPPRRPGGAGSSRSSRIRRMQRPLYVRPLYVYVDYLEAERCGQSGCHSPDTTSRRVWGGSFVETGPFWTGRDWQPGHVCGQSREALDDSRPY